MSCGDGEVAHSLGNDEVLRYSRQMILPELGVRGQEKLKGGSVLVVGMGGLGSPAAMFLAAAGVGRIGLLDYDTVEESNLHRQVIHGNKTVGLPKVKSAQLFISNLNPHVSAVEHSTGFTVTNARDLVSQYDIVCDCTDNAATRYLLNDACVLENKVLVSGSALRFEGQLTTYHHGEDGPCYRCLFPLPPPPQFVTNCSDGGVLGPVPGLIGTLQALEAIKLLAGLPPSYSKTMLMFDGLSGAFRQVKVRSKQTESCPLCSGKMTSLLEDYPAFCGGSNYDDKDTPVSLLKDSERVSALEYKERYMGENGKQHILIDVREPGELAICRLPWEQARNFPYSKMGEEMALGELGEALGDVQEVVLVCRRGNDSQRGVVLLREKFKDMEVAFKDIRGGLHAWAKEVDSSFPVY